MAPLPLDMVKRKPLLAFSARWPGSGFGCGRQPEQAEPDTHQDDALDGSLLLFLGD